MNTVVIRRAVGNIAAQWKIGKPLVLVALTGLLIYPPTRAVVFSVLAEAYYQVSIFVAATLFGVLVFERLQQQRLYELLEKHQRWQVMFAAIFGAIPGCGGAIFVVMQYVRGSVSFGGLVATLTATMGDAAFLLLAKSPADAGIVFGICLVAGIICGYIIDITHGRDFLRFSGKPVDDDVIEESKLLPSAYRLWLALFVPGAVIGIGYAFQVDVAAVLAVGGVDWVTTMGSAAAILAVVMWALSPFSDIRMCLSEQRAMTSRVADMTNFITVWVLLGFIGYGILEQIFKFDLAALFSTWIWWIPLVAILIGFIPGCGPQVVVTTLFLNGVIPLSAQLANAISNDGDALFPALAIAPKASVIATLYTSLPAVIVGYGWLWLFEI